MIPKPVKKLPEIIANKIAAGEVIERPASVVKELLENAIDAESTRIRIDIEHGGSQLIRLSDNGVGMHRENALLSLERHATSKIATDEDLFSIKTLGFRGEALPSIAAISKMTLITRPKSSDIGTEIQIEGGKILHINDAGAPQGTFISVKDIFYNTPARKKYLKSIRTEIAHIIDYMSTVAVGFSSIHFRLFHNGKSVKNWPQVNDPAARIADVMGDDLYKKLFPVQYKNDHVSIQGYAASPETSRKTSSSVIFVNGRVVRDRLINHAIFEGYRGRILKGQHPVVALFLDVPYEDVDVNVHPAKHNVRFVHQGSIHQAIVQAIQKGLTHTNRTPWQSNPEKTPTRHALPENEKIFLASNKTTYDKQPEWIDIPDTIREYQSPSTFVNKPHTDLIENKPLAPSHDYGTVDPSQQYGEKLIYTNLRIIGQFQKTYIVCENDGSMYLIDQHAAHERIVYERLKNALMSKKIAVQRLLIPETIELTYQQASIFSEILPELLKIGIDISHFGGNTFVVKAVPDILTGKDIHHLFVEMADTLPEIKDTTPIEQAIDDCIMLMACHSAIRSGQILSELEIRTLLKELDLCEHPSQCPHGRPTCIQWDQSLIEKKFKRIV
ncbi:MAG: DNA mismatch repair endonuclease MutL [Candidatus Magnetomorum sp.]|nr:DNA mismatch repair endonuclease MutL [Candidatus Magnetomorum sp.]